MGRSDEIYCLMGWWYYVMNDDCGRFQGRASKGRPGGKTIMTPFNHSYDEVLADIQNRIRKTYHGSV